MEQTSEMKIGQIKELRGFDKIALEAGERKRVSIPLTRRAFTYYSIEEKAFVVEPGTYEIYVGKSLEDIQAVAEITMSC